MFTLPMGGLLKKLPVLSDTYNINHLSPRRASAAYSHGGVCIYVQFFKHIMCRHRFLSILFSFAAALFLPLCSGAAEWTMLYTEAGETFNDIWGTAADDFYIVCGSGKILHYNGSYLKEMTQASEYLTAVWASSPADVYAVGFNRLILHYDGSSWSRMDSSVPVRDDFHGVWGSSASDIYIPTYGQRIVHYNGSSWSSNLMWGFG